MGDEDGVCVAGLDGCDGMANVQHERTAAHGTAVHPTWGDAQIVGDGDGRFAGGGNAVDVLRLQAGVCQRVQRGVRVELDLAHVGNLAELGGFGGTDDGDGHWRLLGAIGRGGIAGRYD